MTTLESFGTSAGSVRRLKFNKVAIRDLNQPLPTDNKYEAGYNERCSAHPLDTSATCSDQSCCGD
jgi:hypothetical protein